MPWFYDEHMYVSQRVSERPSWNEWPCIQWGLYVDKQGYGRTKDQRYAHRVAFELEYGWLPKEPYVVDHKCRNRACVQPKHLQAVTRAENTRLGETRANRTHCKYGHSDWAVKKNGHRRCAECHRLRQRGEWPPET